MSNEIVKLSISLRDLRVEQVVGWHGETIRCIDPTGCGQPISTSNWEGARIPNVLYLPDLRLQVVEERIIPEEVLIHPWLLDYERQRHFCGAATNYQDSFEAMFSDQEVCILSNLYSRNFFHWVTEELPRVVALEYLGFKGKYVVPRSVVFAAQFLELLGISVDRVVEQPKQPTLFAAVYYAPCFHAHAIAQNRRLFHMTRDRVLAGVKTNNSKARRIWSERRASLNNQGRNLINKDEIYHLLERYGFEVVDMGALPVTEQIKIANSAEVLAGPHGAGFVHSMFMAAGKTVIECYSPDFINPGCIGICRELRHRYFMIVHANAYGAYTSGDDLKVDPEHLELVLQGL